MAAHAKTSDAQIVAAARAIIAERGLDELSLQRVADAVGVRAPSLYKRFDDRASLIAAVRDSLLDELTVVLAGQSGALPAMGHAFRAFGKRLGRLYPLLFAAGAAPSPSALAALAPVMTALDAAVGPAHALRAARTVTAFLHGFVTMELNASFQMAEPVDDAFVFGLNAVLRGIREATAAE